MITIKNLPDEELFYGSMSCAGCGGSLALRLALKVLGKNTVVVIPPCCMSGVSCMYPQLAVGVPCLMSTMPGTASVISGFVAGFKQKGISDVTILGVAGDGGTMDIGLQALSGAMERGEKFIFLCYDNEAYMNTGNQRSGATPSGAYTTTTPGGQNGMWENRPKKDMIQIAKGHGIPYAATASLSHVNDYLKKVEKAMSVQGPSYIQVMAPCPSGWGFPVEKTIEIGRMAVESGLWKLLEHENGETRITYRPSKRLPVGNYLKSQDRFAHMSDEQIKTIQDSVDTTWSNC